MQKLKLVCGEKNIVIYFHITKIEELNQYCLTILNETEKPPALQTFFGTNPEGVLQRCYLWVQQNYGKIHKAEAVK